MKIKVRELIWDEFNSSHIAKHSVTEEEVEEVSKAKLSVFPSHSNRYAVIGKTKRGRMLTIILAQKNKGIFYPASARDASHKERRWLKDDKN